ncbi:hypothetical protein E4U43_003467 [Claviceps pusilla]|uniref:Fe2OG dioxygenase domain-containing protein n=1 Tax=Claviceps pusilla TaxID=123648 RepID=A0A9P7N6T0_9HYPO|nr:hypothetical protein E4U43_003467 [Claviceps pusilla]
MSQTANIPRIDISPLLGDSPALKQQVAQAIDAASRDTGFFYATNHGVDLARLAAETRRFHTALTADEKDRLAIRAYNPQHTHKIRSGYSLAIPGRKAVESLCYLNPAFTPDHPRIATPTPLHETNDWPPEHRHPGFRAFAESYFWDVYAVAAALLRGYALALHQPEDFFTRHFRRHDTLSSVVLIRYPFLDPYPAPAIKTAADDGTKLSFEWHRDVDLITVLYQSDVQNLQVKTAHGDWLDIEPDDSAYLVNCGTYMSHITGEYYPAPVHRVKWRNEERQSLPFFVNLGYEDAIQPWDAAAAAADADARAGAADKNENLLHRPLPDREPIPYGEYLQSGLLGLIQQNGQT